ncbi:transposase [Merismopedia glauca]|uniref:Transposase n=1 Tax=Merismopedia glauca CCAP 1448/3 TaxID=1296344 RepID=A0A2T1C1W6_9CYAN|nr:transposase [Merismopedia glauca]PSB02232.1 transposase [Merismopedia glauca CCAP 1448/3]
MKYNPDFHHRRSHRLQGYDYSSCGAYFMTIRSHNRECIFGEISEGEMQLNELGKIARSHWQQLSQRYQNLQIDESIVMPNHLHGIIILLESSSDRRKSISEIIRGFKTFSTRQINGIRHQYGIPVWQRNYYDRIIRSEEELNNVREYILKNPQNWDIDTNKQDL